MSNIEGKNIIIFGAPGSGKGTQSAFLISRFGLRHISTGDLFRSAIQNKTPLGVKARSYMDRGKLVPDSIVMGMVKEVLDVLPDFQGFILDGVPRTLIQAQDLKKIMDKLGRHLHKVLYLKLEKNLLMKRLTGRRVAEKSGHVYHIQFHPPRQSDICDKTGEKLIQRKDDQEEVVKERLSAYFRQTVPVLDFYRDQNILEEIEGEGAPEEIFLQIQKSLNFI